MRVTQRAGTDLSVALGEYPVMIQYGYAETPGRFDHWGAGLVHTFPNEGSANGTVVIRARRHRDPALLPLRRRTRSGSIFATVSSAGSRAVSTPG